MLRRLQQILAHVPHWEVVDGQTAELMQTHAMPGSGSRLAAEDDAQAPPGVLPPEARGQRHRGGWSHVEVFERGPHTLPPCRYVCGRHDSSMPISRLHIQAAARSPTAPGAGRYPRTS